MRRALLSACAWGWLAIAGAHAQQTPDVPFVGTPPAVVDAMLEMARVGPDDMVVDLGCGDGRLVIAAARRYGARGYGVDLDGNLIARARAEAQREGVAERVRFEERNLYVTHIGEASVLTLYLFPRVNLELRPRILRELKPGTRVVSHEFDFGAWRPDARTTVAVPDKPYGPPKSEVYLWIVPADAAGRWSWRLPDGSAREVSVEQTFQQVTITGGSGERVEQSELAGDRIAFVVVSGGARREYSGRVAGDAITGSTRAGGTESAWTATRTVRGKMNIDAERERPQRYAEGNR